MINHLIVNEIFGPSLQGEGPSVGRPCMFLRLGNCNLHCYWCDSPFSWRFTDKYPHRDNIVYDPKKELHQMTRGEIVGKLLSVGHPDLIVISGGEPMLQYKKLYNLIRYIQNDLTARVDFEIETTGTIWDDLLGTLRVNFNVSPKLENSGNPLEIRYKPEALQSFVDYDRAIFKFVICVPKDLIEVDRIVNKHDILSNRIYVMAEGITEEKQKQRLQWLVPKAIERGWNITPRLQVTIWGDKRGV